MASAFIAISISDSHASQVLVPTDQSTIQAAIDSAAPNDTVLVSPGTYHENIAFHGKKLTVGSWYIVTGDTAFIHDTVIDGGGSGSVVAFYPYDWPGDILSGFTITNGSGTGVSSDGRTFVSMGGGVFISGSSPILDHLIITGNSAEYGGGIACYSLAKPYFRNITISENTAEIEGGGIFTHYSSPQTINNTVITRNVPNGIFSFFSTIWLSNSSVTGNGPESGLNLDFTIIYYDRVLISANSGGKGGGIFANDSQQHIVNTTIAGNTAQNGGGLFSESLRRNYDTVVVNSIFWENYPESISLEDHDETDSYIHTVTLEHSNIEGGESGGIATYQGLGNIILNWGTGNLESHPHFSNSLAGDYSLALDSPCIDTGITYFEYHDKTIASLPPEMFSGMQPDMGAIEYTPVQVAVGESPPVASFRLDVWPNPFNPAATITFEVNDDGPVTIDVYSILGQHIDQLVDGQMSRGVHTVTWQPDGLAGGVYFLVAHTHQAQVVKKLTLLK